MSGSDLNLSRDWGAGRVWQVGRTVLHTDEMRAQVVIYPGFDELDAMGPLEAMRNARRAGADIETALVSVDGQGVTGSHGIKVGVDGPVSAAAELIVIPGGGWNERSATGARFEVSTGILPSVLLSAHLRGATVAGVCTGVMLLAAVGLTKGRPAITHQSAVQDLKLSGAVLVEARVVDDGDVVTAGGVTAGLDLGLWLIERYCGRKIADVVAEDLEYDRHGLVWLRGRDPLPG